MAFGRQTDEQRAEAVATELARQKTESDKREAAEQESRLRAFEASPQGRARRAYLDGYEILQSEFEVMHQQAVVEVMVGASNKTITRDATKLLNKIQEEGWDLISGSFVFVMQGEQSRDKFMASGQQVAINGVTMGYYLFRRSEKNLVHSS